MVHTKNDPSQEQWTLRQCINSWNCPGYSRSFLCFVEARYEMNADRSTTQTVISSCFDRRARPGGNDMSAWRLEIFLARRTLFRTRRTMTSATVEFRREPKGVARRVVAVVDIPGNFRRLAGLPAEGDTGVSRFFDEDPLFAVSVVASATATLSSSLIELLVAVAFEALSTLTSPSSKLLWRWRCWFSILFNRPIFFRLSASASRSE